MLVVRMPYGKDEISFYAAETIPNILDLLEGGYAIAVQECRGTFRSDGVFVPHVDDAADGAATVAWLREQPWCNGKVGSYGSSYLGFSQWQTAATGVDGLTAIASSESTADLYLAPWYSPGGALSLECGLSWSAMMAADHAQRELAAGRGDVATS